MYFSEFYFISTAKLWTSGWKCFVYFVIKGKKVLAIWLFLIKIAKLSRHIELSGWWSSKIFTVVIRIITRCWIVGVPGLWPAQRPAAWCLVGIILLITIYRSKIQDVGRSALHLHIMHLLDISLELRTGKQKFYYKHIGSKTLVFGQDEYEYLQQTISSSSGESDLPSWCQMEAIVIYRYCRYS